MRLVLAGCILFKGLHFSLLPNVPQPTFIYVATSIPDPK